MGRQKQTETSNPKSALLNTSHKLLLGQATCTSYIPLGRDLGPSHRGRGRRVVPSSLFCFGDNSHFSQKNSPNFPLFWGACRHQSVCLLATKMSPVKAKTVWICLGILASVATVLELPSLRSDWPGREQGLPRCPWKIEWQISAWRGAIAA
jgi:hypothetical protein